MALQATYDLTRSVSLRERIAAAIADAAEDVRNEGAVTANHAERFVWAVSVLSSNTAPIAEADRAIWIVLQNATVNAAGEAVTDNDLQFTVNGLVNFLAGVDTSV